MRVECISTWFCLSIRFREERLGFGPMGPGRSATLSQVLWNLTNFTVAHFQLQPPVDWVDWARARLTGHTGRWRPAPFRLTVFAV